MSFRIVAGFFVLVFGLSIAVQFNDPDPVLWIAIYAVAAVLATAAVFGRFWLVPTGAALACYLVLIGIWWSEHRDVRLAYAALCLPFAGLFMALYTAGWWVG